MTYKLIKKRKNWYLIKTENTYVTFFFTNNSKVYKPLIEKDILRDGLHTRSDTGRYLNKEGYYYDAHSFGEDFPNSYEQALKVFTYCSTCGIEKVYEIHHLFDTSNNKVAVHWTKFIPFIIQNNLENKTLEELRVLWKLSKE